MYDLNQVTLKRISSLTRHLNLFDSTMIVVGNMIGIGLYVAPGYAASHVESAGFFFLAWIIGGLYALTGAITFAELGIRFPRAGGDYVFLRESYGPFMGFLSGWVSLTVTFAGSSAALSLGLSEYVGVFFPLFSDPEPILRFSLVGFRFGISPAQALAVVIVWGLTLNFCFSSRKGVRFQNWFTVLKIFLLVLFCGLGVLFGSVNPANLESWRHGTQTLSGFGLALIPILFTYSGWNAITYVAGEVEEPKRTVPRSLVIGTLAVILIYLMVNAIYVLALSAEEFQGNILVAGAAAAHLFGETAGKGINGVIIISILSGLNSTILVGSRISYAMALDRVFVPPLAEIHPRWRTPFRSLVFQGIWTSLLIFSGTFEQLLTFVVFGILVFSALTASSVFIFRRREKTGSAQSSGHTPGELNLDVTVGGLPFCSSVFFLCCAGLVGNTVAHQFFESAMGILLILAGTPVYLFYRSRA